MVLFRRTVAATVAALLCQRSLCVLLGDTDDAAPLRSKRHADKGGSGKKLHAAVPQGNLMFLKKDEDDTASAPPPLSVNDIVAAVKQALPPTPSPTLPIPQTPSPTPPIPKMPPQIQVLDPYDGSMHNIAAATPPGAAAADAAAVAAAATAAGNNDDRQWAEQKEINHDIAGAMNNLNNNMDQLSQEQRQNRRQAKRQAAKLEEHIRDLEDRRDEDETVKQLQQQLPPGAQAVLPQKTHRKRRKNLNGVYGDYDDEDDDLDRQRPPIVITSANKQTTPIGNVGNVPIGNNRLVDNAVGALGNVPLAHTSGEAVGNHVAGADNSGAAIGNGPM